MQRDSHWHESSGISKVHSHLRWWVATPVITFVPFYYVLGGSISVLNVMYCTFLVNHGHPIFLVLLFNCTCLSARLEITESKLWDNGPQFLTPILETMDGGVWFQFSLSQQGTVFSLNMVILHSLHELSNSVYTCACLTLCQLNCSGLFGNKKILAP